MRVLLVHNFYRSPPVSGEDLAYRSERDFLRQAGHEVLEYCRANDDLGRFGPLRAGLCAAWNPAVRSSLRRLLMLRRPDLMHVHNTFPLLSPAVFYTGGETSTATVLTVHNYRIFCPAGTASSQNGGCLECLTANSVSPAIRRGCYRNSRLATLAAAAMVALHRRAGTWQTRIDAFIALSSFQKELLISAGVPESLIHIKPNLYFNPPDPVSWEVRERKVIYVGRISIEKGVRFLIEAWDQWGTEAPRLEILGDGPERPRLEASARQGRASRSIRFFGAVPFSHCQERLSTAALLIVPSICFEGFPQTIREAFALGVPVAASRLGSLASIIQEGWNGVLFAPGDGRDLRAAVQKVWNSPQRLKEMGRCARMAFETQCSPRAHSRAIFEIYQQALEHRRAMELAAA